MNTKIKYRVQDKTQLDPYLSQSTSNFFKIHFIFHHHRLTGFPTKGLYASYLFRACYMTRHLIVLELVFLTIFHKESSILCSSVQPPVTSCLLGPNVLLSKYGPSFTPIPNIRRTDPDIHCDVTIYFSRIIYGSTNFVLEP